MEGNENKPKKSNKKIVLIALVIVLITTIIGIVFSLRKDKYIDTYSAIIYENNNINIDTYKDHIITDSNKKDELLNYYNLEDNYEFNFEKYNYIVFIKTVDFCGAEITGIKSIKVRENIIKATYGYKEGCGDCYPKYNLFLIPVDKDININNYEVIYNMKIEKFVSCGGLPVHEDKPIIYIYPMEKINLTIKLKNDYLLTHTYPKYNNSWDIIVDTNGNIYDKNTKRNYYALYWEGINDSKLDMSSGFVVKGTDTIKFLEEKLEYLGLNEKEINEFIIYWLPKMENNKYNFIRFKTKEEIENYMPIEISKTPDTLIRVYMDFMPLDKKINVSKQKLEKVIRHGYTIVEWGGREVKEK